MTLSAVVSSSTPFIEGYYQISGGVASPVNIVVYNSSSSPARIKTLYLTCINGAVSLGEPNLIRRGVSYAPANNIVPAATTVETSGSIPIPSGSGDTDSWIILPFQQTYTVGSPPLELGPYHKNIGYWAFAYDYDPPFLLPVYPSNNNSSIVTAVTPIVSGATPITSALNFTSSVYTYDPNASQGAIVGQLGNYGLGPPPTSSLANQFTYEWWSNLRSYGIPFIGAAPSTNAGTVWKTFGFPFLEGSGIQIGYLKNGSLYCMMEQDFTATLPESEINAPPYVGISSSAIVPTGSWVHQAITRNASGQITFWINGTGSGGGTRATGSNPHYCNNYYLFCDNLTIPYLNIDDESDPYNGLIETTCDGLFMEMRMSDVVRYTTNFTPSTASYSASYSGGGGSIPVTSSQTTLGSASYNSFVIPQVLAETYFPQNRYSFQLGAVVMKGEDPSVTVATASLFRVTGSVI